NPDRGCTYDLATRRPIPPHPRPLPREREKYRPSLCESKDSRAANALLSLRLRIPKDRDLPAAAVRSGCDGAALRRWVEIRAHSDFALRISFVIWHSSFVIFLQPLVS